MDKKKIFDLLVDEEIFLLKGGPFKTSGGLEVPFYIDFRKICYNPQAMETITRGFIELIKEEEFDVIAGIETTGIPFAACLSKELNKPLIWLRKKLRGHGRQTTIAGKLPEKDAKILIIDDSVGGGDSVVAIIKNLQEEGYNKITFAYLMEGDIMKTAKERISELEKEGIRSLFISTWKEWIDYLLENDKISEKLAQYNYEFIDNPISFDKEKLEQYREDLENGNLWIGENKAV